jgi:drug/metabolite transporter (DMT)-like permease
VYFTPDDPTVVAPAPLAAALSAERSPLRGHLQVIVGSTLFAANASVSKVVLDAGIEPARLTALRCLGTALVLGVVLGVTQPGRLRIAWSDVPTLIVLGLSGAALIQWLYFVAIDRLPVGIALLLEFTGPLLIALYSRVVLRHAIARQVWLALAIALAGLALVAQVWHDAGLDPVGVAAGLAAAACLATFYLLGQRTVEQRDPLNLAFWMFAVAAVFWSIVQPWWNFDAGSLAERTSLLGRLDGFDVPVWVPLAWVVVLGTLVPYAFNVAALRHISATAAGVIGMIEPVTAAAVAWLWLDQVLTPIQLAGGALVLLAVTLVQTAHQPLPTLDLPSDVSTPAIPDVALVPVTD